MRLSKKESDPAQVLGRADAGHMLVMLDRGDYWQCAYVIPKGGNEKIRARGVDAFAQRLVELAPFLSDRVQELTEWDQIKLLTVMVDRLKKWYRPGLLCIGDAAHAMSPIGGVGINLAIQDAVAAARILRKPLLDRDVRVPNLQAVQDRRDTPTALTQRMQLFIQKRVISNVLTSQNKLKVPLVMRLLNRWRCLRRIPARLLAVGFRPEHIDNP